MSELAGQVAIVTGGSRGIGRAICEALADGGARVAVVARNGELAAEVASELPGDGHMRTACDVGDSDACVAVVKAVEAELGSLGILVNNAGITRDNIFMRMKNEE